MKYISILSILIMILALLLPFFIDRYSIKQHKKIIEEKVNILRSQNKKEKRKKINPAIFILALFGIVVLIHGILTFIFNFNKIKVIIGEISFALWLFFTMIFGMFVQVLSRNYREKRKLFQIGWEQLVFPLLFSIIIFYPIWGIISSSNKSYFSFYCAFLNGYFWENIVAEADLKKINKP